MPYRVGAIGKGGFGEGIGTIAQLGVQRFLFRFFGHDLPFFFGHRWDIAQGRSFSEIGASDDDGGGDGLILGRSDDRGANQYNQRRD